MKTAILSSESDANLNLLIELADKLGIRTKVLSDKDAEDLDLVYAIKEGKTGEHIDTQEFINALRQ